MSGLGIDPEKALDYLMRELPSFQAFEEWVLREAGGRLDPEAVEAVNRTILTHELDATSMREFQEELGLPSDTNIRSTARLDELDDLVQFHRILTSE